MKTFLNYPGMANNFGRTERILWLRNVRGGVFVRTLLWYKIDFFPWKTSRYVVVAHALKRRSQTSIFGAKISRKIDFPQPVRSVIFQTHSLNGFLCRSVNHIQGGP